MRSKPPFLNVTVYRNRLFLIGALLMLGIAAFFFGLITGKTTVVWTALLINVLFFVGLSYGGLVFSVILTLTSAKWGRPFKRIAESMGAFIPVGWFLFGTLFLGMDSLFEWMDPAKVLPAKQWWLNQSDFILRNSLLLLLTGIIGLLYLASALIPDLRLLSKMNSEGTTSQHLPPPKSGNGKLFRGFSATLHKGLAPLLGLAYALLSFLLAFDWIMSMDQTWFSAAFGVQYMAANLYAALALVMIVGYWGRSFPGMKAYLTVDRFQDLSRFLLAVAMFWAYIVFSQILVIWYANLPHETSFLVKRMLSPEWSPLFKGLFVVLFLLPLFGLLTRKACRTPWFTALISLLLLLGLWAEKGLLIAPSVQERILTTDIGFDLISMLLTLLISLGVLSAFLMVVLGVGFKFPLLPFSDPLLTERDV